MYYVWQYTSYIYGLYRLILFFYIYGLYRLILFFFFLHMHSCFNPFSGGGGWVLLIVCFAYCCHFRVIFVKSKIHCFTLVQVH